MGRSVSRARLLLATVAAAMILAGGCSAYRSVGSGASARPSAPVRVYFADARQLRVASADGDTTIVQGVTELTGELADMSGDTIEVRVRSLNRAPAQTGATVRFARASEDRIETEQFDPWGTVLVTIGAIVAVAGIAFLVGLQSLGPSY